MKTKTQTIYTYISMYECKLWFALTFIHTYIHSTCVHKRVRVTHVVAAIVHKSLGAHCTCDFLITARNTRMTIYFNCEKPITACISTTPWYLL